jgi:hypothetical protein
MGLEKERSTSQSIFGDGCVLKIRSSWLQKSPSLNSGERRKNSPDISRGSFQLGIWEFDPFQVSQAVRPIEIYPPGMSEMPTNGGVLRTGGRSPGSGVGRFRLGLADIFEIFPFSGAATGDRPRTALLGQQTERGSFVVFSHFPSLQGRDDHSVESGLC